MRIKSIHLLVLKAFVRPFCVVLPVLLFVFLTQHMLKYADYLTGKGIGMSEIGEVMLYSAFYLLPQMIPLSVLVASLIAFGTLGEHNELTAIKSAGVSLIKIISPVFIFVLFLAAASYKYNDVLLPKANIKVWSLLHDISQKKAPFSLQEGVFSSGLSGYSIKVDERLDEGHTLKGIMIYQKTDKGQRNDRLVVADSGKMYNLYGDRYLVLELYNGEEYREDAEIMQWAENRNKPFLALAHSKFSKSKMVIDMSELALQHTPEERFLGHKRMKTFSQIWQMSDSLGRGYIRRVDKLYADLQPYYTYHFKTPNNKIMLDSFDFSRINLKSPKVIKTATQFSRRLVSASTSFQETLKHYTWTAANFEIEAWTRYNNSISCILLFLIGASIGAIVKKGGLGIPALIAFFIFIIYYILSSNGQKLSKELVLDVEVGMMLCNFVLIPVAIISLLIAARDKGFGAFNIFRFIPAPTFICQERQTPIVYGKIKEIDPQKVSFYIRNIDYLYKRAKNYEEHKQSIDLLDEAVDYMYKGINQKELLHRLSSIPKFNHGLETFKGYYHLNDKWSLGNAMGINFALNLFYIIPIPWVIRKSMMEKVGVKKFYNIFFILIPGVYFYGWFLYKYMQEKDMKRKFQQGVEQLKSIQKLMDS